MLIQVKRVRKNYVYGHGVRLEVGDSSSYSWGRRDHSMHFADFVYRHSGDPANNCYWENQIFSKGFLIKLLDIYYDVTGYSDTDAFKTRDEDSNAVIGVSEDTLDYNYSYRITLSGEGTDISQMIDYLREKFGFFYSPKRQTRYIDYKSLGGKRHPGKKIWISSNPSFRNDAFNRMVEAEKAARKYSLKQFEKDLDLAPNLDLPWDLSRDEAEKVMNYCMNDVIATQELMREKQRIEGQEAIESIRMLYYTVATKYERELLRLDECLAQTRDWPETSYMLKYIQKRVETADSNVDYFAKMKDELQKQVNTLKDLINQIHEESDI